MNESNNFLAIGKTVTYKHYNPLTHALYDLKRERVIPKGQVGVEREDAKELIECHQSHPICLCQTVDGECALDRLSKALKEAGEK